MKNFLRAVRMALAYRWTLAITLVCALMVGLLWGANIGTVYPFVEVAIKGQTLQQWVDREITDTQAHLQELRTSIPRLQIQALSPGPHQAQAAGALSLARTRLEADEKALARYRWLRPYVYQYVPHDAFQTVALIALVLLIGTLVKDVFLVGNSVNVDRLANLATFDLRKMLFRKTLKLDLAAFGNDGSGELMSRFTFDMENLQRGLVVLFGKAIREPLKMAACLAGAAWICWRLLLLSLVLAPLAAYAMSRLSRSLKRANRRAMEEMSQIYSLLEETFLGIKVVKAFTMESYERRRFHKTNKNYYAKSMRIANYEALGRPVTELMGISTILVALLAGAYLVLKGQTHLFGIPMSDRPLGLSALLLFYGLLSGVSDPGRKLSEVFGRLQRAAAAADRIFALLDRPIQIADPVQPVSLPRHRREIVFDNVTFGYQREHPVLEQVNLSVPWGETVAIVGPNGCGKTTLVNLLPRFFDPDAGVVRIDGVDLRSARLPDLRGQIGLVTQETLLFDDTVFNNIRYGFPHATAEEVIEAAKQAHAHRFIEERLARGYDTLVGPQGNSLSGGQRQRIALARAILRDPAILILDEATSQIDIESEQLIHKVLEKFIRNRTTFIITHRVSTLALAQRIVVMNAGRIIDMGTHEQLQSRCSFYRRLYDLEFRESA
jgi:ATP-binding cassette subfamily B protein/subfamily B ATP-binding cassette protein MsbA